MRALRAKWSRMVCALRGHADVCVDRRGGWPEADWFAIDAFCRRCGADRSIVISSQLTISPGSQEVDCG
jgi:hypothetical protein